MSDAEQLVTAVVEALVGERSLARALRETGRLDPARVAELLRALEELREAWAERWSVPKRLALAFLDIQPPLWRAAEPFDVAVQNAAEDAGVEIVMAASALLEEGMDSAPAEANRTADQILHDGLVTETSLQVKLRMGAGLDQAQLAELRAAFLDAASFYSGAPEVSKRLALACVDLPSSMTEGFGRYSPDQQQEIEQASRELVALAQRVLS